MLTATSLDPIDTTPLAVDTHRLEIAEELVDITLTHVNTQLEPFTTQLARALRTAVAPTSPGQAHANAAATLLIQNRYPFYYAISARVRAVLEQAMQALLQPSLALHGAETVPVLLAPDLEADKKITLIKLGRAIETDYAQPLAVLGARIAQVMGRDALAPAQHPLRPVLLLNAVHDAWCEFHPDPAAHPLVFRLLQRDLCIELAPIVDALNTALARRGVLPALPNVTAVVRTARVTDLPDNSASGAPLQQQLQHLLAPAAASAAKPRPFGADAFPTLFHNETLQLHRGHHALREYLTALPKSSAEPTKDAQPLLQEILHAAPSGGWPQADRVTIELLVKIFDLVLHNPAIPSEMKALIGSLQLPVLKAALNDRKFFFNGTHPARRTIELMATLSFEWDYKKGPNDPLHQLLLRNVKRIQSDQRISAFDAAVSELDAFIAEGDVAIHKVLAAPIAQALQREKMRVATKTAKHEVALRIGTGEVVAFVETFLEDKWTSVLTLAYTLQDEKPQIAQSAVKTMDDLCWSVKPKITADARKELVARLPSIIATLNKWLDAIKWQDDARVRFFDELARCHASIVRAPLEMSPERQLRVALKAAKKATERRLQRQAKQAPEPVADAFVQQVTRLAQGTWVQFMQKSGATVRVKVAWISPARSLFIFATRERQEAFSLSDDDLAQAFREQRAQVLTTVGLVDRALTEALAPAGATNDPVGPKSAA